MWLLPTSSTVSPAAVTHGVCKFPLWQQQQSILVTTQQQPHKTQKKQPGMSHALAHLNKLVINTLLDNASQLVTVT
jgi:hypothetical protein